MPVSICYLKNFILNNMFIINFTLKFENYFEELIFNFLQFLGYGEYFFNDTPTSCEESFPDLARGEMSKKKMPTGEWTI
jgi:hypothetical protein